MHILVCILNRSCIMLKPYSKEYRNLERQDQKMSFGINFDGIDYGDRYNSYEEALEAADEMASAYNQGSVDLYNENPGDYPEESGDNTGSYEIFEEE